MNSEYPPVCNLCHSQCGSHKCGLFGINIAHPPWRRGLGSADELTLITKISSACCFIIQSLTFIACVSHRLFNSSITADHLKMGVCIHLAAGQFLYMNMYACVAERADGKHGSVILLYMHNASFQKVISFFFSAGHSLGCCFFSPFGLVPHVWIVLCLILSLSQMVIRNTLSRSPQETLSTGWCVSPLLAPSECIVLELGCSHRPL